MRTKLVGNNQVILNLASWIIREYSLFREVFRFHNSDEAVMNFAKYIVAHILAKLKYFAKRTLFVKFSSSQALK